MLFYYPENIQSILMFLRAKGVPVEEPVFDDRQEQSLSVIFSPYNKQANDDDLFLLTQFQNQSMVSCRVGEQSRQRNPSSRLLEKSARVSNLNLRITVLTMKTMEVGAQRPGTMTPTRAVRLFCFTDEFLSDSLNVRSVHRLFLQRSRHYNNY